MGVVATISGRGFSLNMDPGPVADSKVKDGAVELSFDEYGFVIEGDDEESSVHDSTHRCHVYR